jgi:hypothetical protein
MNSEGALSLAGSPEAVLALRKSAGGSRTKEGVADRRAAPACGVHFGPSGGRIRGVRYNPNRGPIENRTFRDLETLGDFLETLSNQKAKKFNKINMRTWRNR